MTFLETLMKCRVCGRTHLHFEDDAIICRDFQTRALEVIRQYPDHLISLFHGMTKRTAGESEVRSAGTFTTTLALYIPPWFTVKEDRKIGHKRRKRYRCETACVYSNLRLRRVANQG